jgi:hypothetical protein
VARRLAAASPQQLRVVVVHQPAAVARARERVHLLRGHAQALRAWAAAGADVVMGGHIHLPYTLPVPGLARRLCVVQAGTAVSSRTRPEAPNSVNLLRWSPAGDLAPGAAPFTCCIERWDYAPGEQRFSRMEVSVIEPQRP